MPDPFISLPQDDESVDALLDDFKDYLRDQITGWEPSDAALEVALGAAFADEASTLYSLVRERATDEYRDFGIDILGVSPGNPVPASTLTTWTARAAAPVGGIPLPAGTTIVLDAAAGRFAFEVLEDELLPEGDTVLTGVIVQSVDPGSAPNGATGTVLFDDQPAWLLSVTVDQPASGGSDGQTDDEHLAAIRRTAQLLSRVPIKPWQWELLAQEVPEVARALVRDMYDETTGLSDQTRTVSIYPVQLDGTAVSPAGKAAITALVAARREIGWVARIADPTYTVVKVDITVAAEEGVDHSDLATRVQQALTDDALNPATWGNPRAASRPTFRRRTKVWRYEIASTADGVDGVSNVELVKLAVGAGVTADADLALTGSAPLPTPGTITVTVVDAT